MAIVQVVRYRIAHLSRSDTNLEHTLKMFDNDGDSAHAYFLRDGAELPANEDRLGFFHSSQLAYVIQTLRFEKPLWFSTAAGDWAQLASGDEPPGELDLP